jgi:hypothetical protein
MRILAVLFVVACGSASKPTPTPVSNSTPAPVKPAEPEGFVPLQCEVGDHVCDLRQLTRFSGEMCKCTSKACADKVLALYTEWATKMAKRVPNEKLAPEILKPLGEQTQKFGECLAKLLVDPASTATTPDP